MTQIIHDSSDIIQFITIFIVKKGAVESNVSPPPPPLHFVLPPPHPSPLDLVLLPRHPPLSKREASHGDSPAPPKIMGLMEVIVRTPAGCSLSDDPMLQDSDVKKAFQVHVEACGSGKAPGCPAPCPGPYLPRPCQITLLLPLRIPPHTPYPRPQSTC